MSIKMPDYQQGKIYKIVNLTSDNECDCYVGSTCNSLSKRFSQHKKRSKYEVHENVILYQQFSEVCIDNFRIVLIEDFPCNSRDELRAREEYHRSKLGARYNMVRALITQEEVKQQYKEYYEQNKDAITLRKKKYRETNKEKIKEYREQNKERIIQRKREYNDQNKDKLKEYYQQNKDTIKAKASEEFKCECGSTVRCGEKARHFKTQKHTQYIEEQKNEVV